MFWLQTPAETTQEREGGAFSSKHQRQQGRETEKQGQKTEAGHEKGEQRQWGDRDKEAGWARPQTQDTAAQGGSLKMMWWTEREGEVRAS